MRQKPTVEIKDLRGRFAPFCRKYAIRRLEVFGSTVRGEMKPGSDLDLLACFGEGGRPQTSDLLEMAGEAEEIAGRPVDFVLRENLESSANPYSRQHILEHSVCIYGD